MTGAMEVTRVKFANNNRYRANRYKRSEILDIYGDIYGDKCTQINDNTLASRSICTCRVPYRSLLNNAIMRLFQFSKCCRNHFDYSQSLILRNLYNLYLFLVKKFRTNKKKRLILM